MEVTVQFSKDRENLRKHGISLKRAEDFEVDTACLPWMILQDYGEIRYNAIGWIDAQLYSSPFGGRRLDPGNQIPQGHESKSARRPI